MQAISYTEARNRLKHYMDQASRNREPTIIHRQNGEDMVLVSLADYEALEETAYLLRSPANARRIFESVRSFREGGGTERELIGEEG